MYKIGIDFGGTNIAIGLVDANGKIKAKLSVPTPAKEGMDAVVATMDKTCRALVAQEGLTLDDVSFIGVASPGAINGTTGCIEYYSGMDVRNYPLAANLSKATGVKDIRCENDANAAALAEAKYGAAAGSAHSITVTLGTGVGGGIIVDGKVYAGFNHSAAEIGHMVIVADGILCSCARKGCFESYSSATALIRDTKFAMDNNPTSAMHDIAKEAGKVSGKTAFLAAKKGDKAAQDVVDQYIKLLACGLANLINLFQPEVLCISGGISGEGDNLLVPLTKLVMEEQYAKTTPNKTKLLIAALGNDAGIVGAASL